MIILNQRSKINKDTLSERKITKQDYDHGTLLKALNYYGQEVTKGFVIDDDNKEACDMLIKYFMFDPEFETMGENFSLCKGILLTGPTGTGKTVLMVALDLLMAKIGNELSTFVITPTRSIERDYIENGSEVITSFGKNSYKRSNEQRVYCFDDLGLEAGDSKYYGNHVCVMAEILLDRYDLGLLTHATTNLGPDSFEKIYGDRVRSRMSEMFNKIILKGADRRRK